MASNDGRRMTVFGLGYSQHDTRKMHRILDHYERLPDNASNRVALYTNLATLAREIPSDEAQSIETWLASGGDFPFARPVRQPLPEVAPPFPPHYGRHHGAGRHHRPRRPDLEPPRGIHGDENDDEEEVDDTDGEDEVGQPLAQHPAPPHGPHVRHGMNRHPHRHHHRHNQAAHDPLGDNFGLGQGQMLGENAGPPPLPPQAPGPVPRHQPRAAVNPPQGGFGQFHPGALDPFLGHGPLPGHMPGHPVPHLPRMPPGPGFGQGLPGMPGPFLGHGAPGGYPRNPTAFDIIGPGRRLGEEGEEDTPQAENAVNPEESQQYEEIFHEAQETFDEEMHDDMEEEDLPANQDKPEDVPQVENTASSPAFDPELPTVECEVCYESLPASDFPADTITPACRHETKVCYGCLEQHIAVQIQEGVLGQLKCPSCPEKLSYEDIQAYASPDIFERYKYLLSRTDKNMFMCLAPNCGAGQIHEGGKEQPQMVCKSCNFAICTYHGRPWHDGQTCAEFDVDPSQIERLEEEEATAKLLAADSRICPSCNQGVSKTMGCDHMACRCGKAWCFVCEADWENILRFGGGGHARHCIYHPDHVRKRPDELNADRARALHAIHGGEVSDELRQAREEFQTKRREAIRPLALEAAEKRMQEVKKNTKAEEKAVAASKKRKVNLKPAWEEGGHARKAFGG